MRKKKSTMKSYLIFLSLMFVWIIFSASVTAQVPNGSFESWSNEPTTNVLMPDEWSFTAIPEIAVPITPCSNSYSGDLAAQGEVMETGLPVPGNLLAPQLTSLPYGVTDFGFPITQKYTELKGFYQFESVGDDRFHVIANIYHDTLAVGVGCMTYLTSVENYTLFTVNINYISDLNPNFCLITFIIHPPEGENTVHPGSQFLVDDLTLDGTVSIRNDEKITDIPESFILEQNYPNPFNTSTTISYQLPHYSKISLNIYDVNGRKLKTLINKNQPAGEYDLEFDASNFASGIYIYSLITENRVISQKFNLLK